MRDRVALIPAYEPDLKMVAAAHDLWANGFLVIVIDDGSSAACKEYFEDAEAYAIVLHHEKNRGKGEAIKTGLQYLQARVPLPCVIVTVDADGQHKTEDVLRVTQEAEAHPDAVVLGSRKMEGKVPVKSRFGNAITRAVFRLMTGQRVYDTQTGLRAFASEKLDEMLEIPGSRYEYEMNVLLELAKRNEEIREVWIDTIYINENASSHFHPLRDSVRVYSQILKFSASSFISFLIDYAAFCVLFRFTSRVVLSNVLARLISGSVNFTLNHKVVFASKEKTMRAVCKYVLLAAGILVLNTWILKGLTAIGISAFAAKVITEVILFFASYIVQNRVVFKSTRKEQILT
ncbi:MAG: bifunctional glycosyltransferase family 2/GtrA family protein [Lachnospiraceae bacterium]|nr:bifunctional glycosyltransferase family 2/GtrA family protein [Lachnospiraceae bacterium]